MPRALQRAYPTFWAGPGWHIIYYPISDWSMFNLGCTVLNGQDTLSEPEDFVAEAILPYFRDAHDIPRRVLRIPRASAASLLCTANQSITGVWGPRRCLEMLLTRWCSISRRARRWRWRMRSVLDTRLTNAMAILRRRSYAIRIFASCAPRECKYHR